MKHYSKTNPKPQEKVYVVECYWNNGEMYDDFQENTTIEGVFSTKEKADMYIQLYKPGIETEYHIVKDTTEDGVRIIETMEDDEFYECGFYQLFAKEMEVQ